MLNKIKKRNRKDKGDDLNVSNFRMLSSKLIPSCVHYNMRILELIIDYLIGSYQQIFNASKKGNNVVV